jgi:hypothetical protein
MQNMILLYFKPQLHGWFFLRHASSKFSTNFENLSCSHPRTHDPTVGKIVKVDRDNFNELNIFRRAYKSISRVATSNEKHYMTNRCVANEMRELNRHLLFVTELIYHQKIFLACRATVW